MAFFRRLISITPFRVGVQPKVINGLILSSCWRRSAWVVPMLESFYFYLLSLSFRKYMLNIWADIWKDCSVTNNTTLYSIGWTKRWWAWQAKWRPVRPNHPPEQRPRRGHPFCVKNKPLFTVSPFSLLLQRFWGQKGRLMDVGWRETNSHEKVVDGRQICIINNCFRCWKKIKNII